VVIVGIYLAYIIINNPESGESDIMWRKGVISISETKYIVDDIRKRRLFRAGHKEKEPL